MRVYQMSSEEVAASLLSDVNFGLSDDKILNKKNSHDDVSSALCGVLSEIKNKFHIVDLIPLLCFLCVSIASVLKQNWYLLFLAAISAAISVFICIGFAAFLNFYRRRFERRLNEKNAMVTVIRNGIEQEIFAKSLTMGDVVTLRKGIILFGDARIIKADNLYVDENYVFSTSIPAGKIDSLINEENLPPDMQQNMLWKGSFVTSGSGKAIITALGDDCYVEKSGGRKKTRQHSWFYSKQNNIGRLASYAFTALLLLCLLFAVIFTGRFSEIFLLIGALGTIVMMNPTAVLTEWSFYRTAEMLYRSGAHIRNINAFDGMQRERKLYYSIDELIKNQIFFDHIEPLIGNEKDCLQKVALCFDGAPFFPMIQNEMTKYGLIFSDLKHHFPIYRRDKDDAKNIFTVFADEGKAVILATGYWEKMLPLMNDVDETLIKKIEALEREGKIVWLMASSTADIIPNQIDYASYENKMKSTCLIVFGNSVSDDIKEKISELQKAKCKIFLINRYNERLGSYICESYAMDGCLYSAPEEPCYTLPEVKKNPYVVYGSASPISQNKAKIVLNDDVSPLDMIYRAKCMFCGINRAAGFMGCLSMLSIFATMALFFKEIQLECILFPILLFRVGLICPSYYLIETVGNCNHYTRSAILGLFCGAVGFIAALTGFETALLSMMLSSVLLCASFLITVRKMRPLKRKDLYIFILTLLAIMIPWFFIGNVQWLVVLLFASFPAISSFIIDIFY